MSFRITAVLSSACLLFVAGCSKTDGKSAAGSSSSDKSLGGVAVVDLDLVAKRLGRDLEMNDEVKGRLTSLNSKLQTLKTSLNRLFDEKKEGFGKEPTEDQQKELLAMQGRMESQLQESKRNAEQDLAAFKQALVNQFREQAKPVLRDVAAARGLSIVVPKNDGLLLTIDPAVDITDAVAEKMLASRSPKTERVVEKTKPEDKETSAR